MPGVPYRERLLARLGDGSWHRLDSLTGPDVPEQTVLAFVRLLTAEGYAIAQEGSGDDQCFRLERPEALRG